MIKGTIIRGMGGLYTARDAEGNEYVLRAKKKFRRLKTPPLVGDEIWLTKGEISDEHGWIEEILPRVSECFRPPVANVTLLLIVVAPEPAPDFLLVDKLLILAERQSLRAAIVVNKTDMDDALYQKTLSQYRGAGIRVYQVSARDNVGVKALLSELSGETVCFSGQSGVGKSTLLNALFGLDEETGDVSRRILRGKNTTRHAELFQKDGVRLMDTPGFSLLEMTEALDPVRLQDSYPEFAPYISQCRFQPCYHLSEPGCAVLAAMRERKIAPERLERYHILLDEAKKVWRERYD